MYQIRMGDNRIIVRHVDQPRHRVGSNKSDTSTSNSATQSLMILRFRLKRPLWKLATQQSWDINHLPLIKTQRIDQRM